MLLPSLSKSCKVVLVLDEYFLKALKPNFIGCFLLSIFIKV